MADASIKESEPISSSYVELLNILKEKIRSSQIKASISANTELIKLYWEIGLEIVQRQKEERWGTKVIDKLAKDLKASFPQMAGFSPRNLFYMKQFAKAYPEFSILQQAAAKLPWGHNMLLIDKLDELNKRLWYYAQKTIENGWSRNVLGMWIESDLYSRQRKAITNFSITLPQPDSDLANATLKDPHRFNFLRMREKANNAPSIGMILCKTKKKLMIEYTLQESRRPI